MKQKKMRYLVLAIFALALPSCMAASRIQDAVVSQQGALPCFSVPSSGLRPQDELQVIAMRVNELDGAERPVVDAWHAAFLIEGQVAVMSADSCMAYGRPGVHYQGEPPEPLKTGSRYEVFINTDAVDGEKTVNRRYLGYFCMVTTEGKKSRVRQVLWDDDAGRRNWDVCDP